MIINPKPLQKGDTIGLVSPSSSLHEGRLELGIEYLQKLGFRVKSGQYVYDEHRFLAGSDAHRAKDIMDFFHDDDVQAIMATCGGYGSQRLLPLLDYAYIRSRPKLVSGFSDTTALQLGLMKKIGLSSCTGFMFRDLLDDGPDPLIERTLMHCLLGESFQIKEGKTVVKGCAEGILTGGNLSLTTALMGTPWQPDFKDRILLIEDVFSPPYQVDCMLSQLDLAGVFEQTAAVVFGQFELCESEEGGDGDIEDVINEWSGRLKQPCIKDFPYGHGSRRCVLPLGKRVSLNAGKKLMKII